MYKSTFVTWQIAKISVCFFNFIIQSCSTFFSAIPARNKSKGTLCRLPEYSQWTPGRLPVDS